METTIISRPGSLEKYFGLKLMFCATLLTLAAVVPASFKAPKENDPEKMLQVKEMTVEEKMGGPEIYPDENGSEEVTFGKDRDPVVPGGIPEQDLSSTGNLIHDREETEWDDYAVPDNESAILISGFL